MSKFLTEKYKALVPYTPGEQPRDMKYIKLNTNESPFPPSFAVYEAVEAESHRLQLYSDPECVELRGEAARVFGIEADQIVMTNGSDEALNFAFMAFADEKRPLFFPDITYGFYPVFADLNRIPYKEIPLKEDFSIDPEDYINAGGVVVIANPNAPTGMFMSLEHIEKIVQSNSGNVVIVDEAYVDFGGESAIKLVNKYDNLIVCGTFSKSRSLAGARLGFAIGQKELIADLNTIRYSTNPYNVNRMTMSAGTAALRENDYYVANCKIIAENREWTKGELLKLGFTLTDSKANFLFAKSDRISGEALYERLKEKGILIRHFTKEKIKEYNRITVGTREQMEAFVAAVKELI